MGRRKNLRGKREKHNKKPHQESSHPSLPQPSTNQLAMTAKLLKCPCLPERNSSLPLYKQHTIQRWHWAEEVAPAPPCTPPQQDPAPALEGSGGCGMARAEDAWGHGQPGRILSPPPARPTGRCLDNWGADQLKIHPIGKSKIFLQRG